MLLTSLALPVSPFVQNSGAVSPQTLPKIDFGTKPKDSIIPSTPPEPADPSTNPDLEDPASNTTGALKGFSDGPTKPNKPQPSLLQQLLGSWRGLS